MVRREIWWADTPGGDRPVLVITRDPVAERATSVVVAACTRSQRGLMSELPIGPAEGMPEAWVVSFDNLHTLRRSRFRSRTRILSEELMDEAGQVMRQAFGC